MDEYKENEIITGTVTGIEPYGIFLNIDNKYTGLIHISEITSSFVKNINDYVDIGEPIKARIIEIDMDNKQLKLSIKNLGNYRFTRKNKQKIQETETGFSGLENNLEKWIEEKIQEIETK